MESDEDCMDDKGHRGRKGPAPVASLEDLSDDSPPSDDKSRLTLPAIKEDPRRMMGPTPRIDISRASSSSHQEDSSPERELLAGGTEGGAKLGLGFTEEMAQELRSSTEELDFQDPEDNETKSRRKKLQSQQAVNKYELETQSEKDFKEGRKDSACSEGGFLFIGGRTSRLSSIGSAASGGSGASGVSGISAASAASHMSGASHLSAASNYSRASRCSSPHRMMLETSFCGPKPIPTPSLEAENPPTEAVLLARDQADPTGAVLPPDTGPIPGAVPPPQAKLYSGKSKLEPSAESSRSRHKSKSPKKKLHRTKKKNDDNELVKIIPLHGSLEEPESEGEPEPEPTAGPPSPPEGGIYIPLKGPDLGRPDRTQPTERTNRPKSTKPPVEENDLVRFISLHGEDDEELHKSREPTQNRNGHNVQFKPWTEEAVYMISKEKERRKARTPEPVGKSASTKLDFASTHGQQSQNYAQSPRTDSRTPSPATSFTRGSFFRRSSDSCTSSRKSQGEVMLLGEIKSKKDSRNKGVFGALFKKNQKEKERAVPSSKVNENTANESKTRSTDDRAKQEERKLPEGDTIIIPLHSPDSIVEPLIVEDPEPLEVPSRSRDARRNLVDASQVPTEVPNEDQPMATNVIVVDVINEDKIVTLEELRDMKRVPSKDSCSSRHSNVQTPISQSTPVNSVHEISRSVRNSQEMLKKEVNKEAIVPIKLVEMKEASHKIHKEVSRENDINNDSKEKVERKDDSRKTVHIKEVPRENIQKKVITSEIVQKQSFTNASEVEKKPPLKLGEKKGSLVDIYQKNIPNDPFLCNEEETATQSKSKVLEKNDDIAIQEVVSKEQMLVTNDVQKFTSFVASRSEDVVTENKKKDIVFTNYVKKDVYKNDEVDEMAGSNITGDSAVKTSSPSPTKEEETPLINSLSEESYTKDEEEEFLLARSNTTESEATVIENHLMQSSQEEPRSSGSEHELDIAPSKETTAEDDTETKSLFQQNDSVDEELPYVPTTLPLERSIGVPIVPVKQRVSEIRTYPIERPRSTTPINPACLEDYTSHDDSSTSSSSSGKMQIVLPRADSLKGAKLKSGGRAKPWNVFAEECLQSPKEARRQESPPPLPPRGATTGPSTTYIPSTPSSPATTGVPAAPNQPAPSWVSFEELPERKRAPKRITTLPHRPHHPHVVYSYVNPEDCSCECHDPKHSND